MAQQTPDVAEQPSAPRSAALATILAKAMDAAGESHEAAADGSAERDDCSRVYWVCQQALAGLKDLDRDCGPPLAPPPPPRWTVRALWVCGSAPGFPVHDALSVLGEAETLARTRVLADGAVGAQVVDAHADGRVVYRVWRGADGLVRFRGDERDDGADDGADVQLAADPAAGGAS